MPSTQARDTPPAKRGRRPGAQPEDVIAIARRRFLEEQSFDVSAIAAEAGIGRTTLWRWFGNREALLGEVLGGLGIETLDAVVRRTRARGPERFVTIVERYFQVVTASEPLLALIQSDPAGTVGILMAPDGGVHPRLVDATEKFIEEEVDRGAFASKIDRRTLASLIVEIGMVHVWANFLTGEEPNIERAVEFVRSLTTVESR